MEKPVIASFLIDKMRVRLKVRDNRIGLRLIHYTWPE